MFPSIPMAAGHYTDSGYRYRFNEMTYYKSWNPFAGPVTATFFDVVEYNSDTFDVKD